MDVVTILATATAKQAFRALAGGGSPSPDALSDVGADLVSAMLEGQAQTDATLSRVEAKLDKLIVDRYRGPSQAAIRMLEQAERTGHAPASTPPPVLG